MLIRVALAVYFFGSNLALAAPMNLWPYQKKPQGPPPDSVPAGWNALWKPRVAGARTLPMRSAADAIDKTTMTIPESAPHVYAVYFRSIGEPPTVKGVVDDGLRSQELKNEELLAESVLAFVKKGGVKVEVLKKSELPPPEPVLAQLSLTNPQIAEQLTAASHVIVLSTVNPRRPPYLSMSSAFLLAVEAAAKWNGILYDSQQFRFRPAPARENRLRTGGGVCFEDYLTMMSSRSDDGTIWITTGGMHQFGLPDLEVKDCPPDLTSALSDVLGACGQRILDELDSQLSKSSASQATVQIPTNVDLTPQDFQRGVNPENPRTAKLPKRGAQLVIEWKDPTNPNLPAFLRVSPSRQYRSSKEASEDSSRAFYRLVAGLSYPNRSKDEIVGISPDDVKLNNGIERAKRELPSVKQRFIAGLPPGSTLHVKVGFEISRGEREFMWVSIQSWKGSTLTGPLANEPRGRTKLKFGQTVDVSEKDVIDWLLKHEDEREEGGYTNPN